MDQHWFRISNDLLFDWISVRWIMMKLRLHLTNVFPTTTCWFTRNENLCNHSKREFSQPQNDDVIKWKHFPLYWTFVTSEFPWKRPITRRFDVFFDLRLNKWLSEQSRGWWFDAPSRSLWRYCNKCTSVFQATEAWWHIHALFNWIIIDCYNGSCLKTFC